MILKRLGLALAFAATILAPAQAAERKPIVVGTTGQQQQIQAADTLKLPAATTANASINIPPGTAPTSPNNGDCWTTTVGLYCRINGATVGPLGTGGGSYTADEITLHLATTTISIKAAGVGTTELANSAVTLAKIANASANTRFLGSGSAGAGAAYAEQTISAGPGVTITPNASGITIAAVGSGISGAAPYVYTNAPFANVSALLHFDGTNGSTTITDVIGGSWTAAGTAAISTARSVYGSASLLVPGSGNSSVKRTTSSAFDVGAGDWAVEFRWWYNGAPQAIARVFATKDGDVFPGIILTTDANSTFTLSLSSNGSSFDVYNNVIAGTLSQSAWNSVIIQRRGIFIEAFINGSQTLSAAIGSRAIYYNAADTVTIGGNATSTSRSMNAYIDDFRFTKGAYVMVPGDPGLPTSAFPNS